MPKRIPRLLTSRLFLAGVVLLLAFWVAAYLVPVAILLQVANATLLCVACAVSVAYAPGVYVSLVERDPNAYIVLGIWLSWTTMAVWRVISLLWILSGTPPALVQNDVIALILFMSASAGGLHLAAKNVAASTLPNGEIVIPRWQWVKLGIVCGCGVGLGLAVVFVNPDLTWIAERLIPWIPR